MPYIKQDRRHLEQGDIEVAMLLRLADYVRAAERSKVPLSFREYMEGLGGSHKTLVSVANAVEHQAEKLLFERAILGGGREHTQHYQKLEGARSKRLQGQVTDYGHVIGQLGLYIEELLGFVLDNDVGSEELQQFLDHSYVRLRQKTYKRRK